MNDYDRSQLNYIMSLDDKQFEEWADSATDDDIKYALEILQAARVEKTVQEYEFLDNLQDYDLEDARAVLKKFML